MSPRQERVHRLLQELTGPGPAACYIDAFRLRYESSPYATTVHLVAHLFREIESAVRGVVAPRKFVPPRKSGHDHEDQIRAVLTLIGLPHEGAEFRVWIDLELQQLAHRQALSTRSRDAAFEQMCDRFDALMDTVLTHFAGVFEVCIRRTDQLRHLLTPGADDVSTIRNGLPNHPSIFWSFFSEILPETARSTGRVVGRSPDPVIRVMLPAHLRALAHVSGELQVHVEGEITLRSILNSIEASYPELRGTIRDYVSHKRRPFIRFFACKRDLSHELPDAPLPDAVANGVEPFLIVGAIAGG